ncbi:unnamed protein product [Rotaria magnacalcarata]|uniref:HAT C-terminal dimerisation domain-containing protein n=1 Tax=Rotaria magnacalcarata TaxID=392030 RepID=A0A816ZL82_9BILA|nr:unnamed protein product [Rotaria magnacalcarata]
MIPATITFVERLFSDSGNTITSRRTRLQAMEQLRKRATSCTSTTSTKKAKDSKEEDDITMLKDNLDDRTFDDDNVKENDDYHNVGCNEQRMNLCNFC